MKFLAKSDEAFRLASRKEDAALLRRAFQGPTQAAMADRGHEIIGASPRQIIYWMQCKNDMPSWAVKAVKIYLDRVESVASKIEGQE